jgi:HNH endonuclease
MPESLCELRMQIDHVTARQHGGATTPENLAFACAYCNRFKGPNISGIDPLTEQLVPLFNPRLDEWPNHFAWNGPLVVGRTTVGRATVRTLQLNHPEAIAVRSCLMAEGLYPIA